MKHVHRFMRRCISHMERLAGKIMLISFKLFNNIALYEGQSINSGQ